MLFVLFFGGEIIEVFFQFGYTFISLIVVLHFFFNNVFFTDSFFLFVMLFRSLEVFLSCAAWYLFCFVGQCSVLCCCLMTYIFKQQQQQQQ
jgi:hypothetical protein